jgi:hypothetical protein
MGRAHFQKRRCTACDGVGCRDCGFDGVEFVPLAALSDPKPKGDTVALSDKDRAALRTWARHSPNLEHVADRCGVSTWSLNHAIAGRPVGAQVREKLLAALARRRWKAG